MRHRRCAVVAGIVASVLANKAYADDAVAPATTVPTAGSASSPAPAPVDDPAMEFVHLHSPSHVTTDGGANLRLPAGYFLSESRYLVLDTGMKVIEDQVTRLTAENDSFRASASSWAPPWWSIAIAVGTGIAGGWYLHSKI